MSKYMVAFCSTVHKLHYLFCVGSLDSQHCDRILNKICIASQEKGNKILYISCQIIQGMTPLLTLILLIFSLFVDRVEMINPQKLQPQLFGTQ